VALGTATTIATGLVACSNLGSSTIDQAAPVSTRPTTSSTKPSPGPVTPSTAGVSAKPPSGLYSRATAHQVSPTASGARPLVYVPNSQSNTVSVIDPSTYRVISSFPVGHEPQHVVPSWDLKTLWVNDDLGNDLVPIDPETGRRGRSVAVDDPYNLYFTPDGAHALVMAERLRRIDVRDPRTMTLQKSLPVPCRGVNHADFTTDGKWMIASCEFSGKLLVIPTTFDQVASVVDLNAVATPGGTDPQMARLMGGPAGSLDRGASAMPQDVRITDDGRTFLAADMLRNGVWVVDAATRKVVTFVPTGKGAHGIYPSRDGKRIFVSNRDAASVSVLDATGRRVITTWGLPKGASPDMGGLTPDGSQLWLSGRYDGTVYVIDTGTGRTLHQIRVGAGPHGLLVWPQPGLHSLGHTGNMRS
jgi:YVTN family beta-propeller protein